MPTEPTAPGDDALVQLRRQYAALVQRLESNQDDFRRLARSAFLLQEDERRRIARELHDGIGQNLTALKHQLAAVQAGLSAAQAPLADKLDASIALCAQTLEDTRNLSRLLRPQILDDLGLEPALRWLVRSLAGAGGVRIELDVAPLPPLDAGQQTLVFRVAQEALSNVVRHAGATQAVLKVEARAPGLRLTVWDDGGRLQPRAVDPDRPGGGAGLHNMRERVEAFGGHLQVESDPATGTWVRAALPLQTTVATDTGRTPA